MPDKEPSGKSVTVFSPFRQLSELHEELNKLWESLPSPFAWPGRTSVVAEHWAPVVDVFQRNGSLVVKAELPGMTEKDIEITVTDDAVILKGEKSEEKETKEEDYYRCERSYGRFSRQIPLPSRGDPDKAKASFKDGVLEIEVPLLEPLPKQKKIEIKPSA